MAAEGRVEEMGSGLSGGGQKGAGAGRGLVGGGVPGALHKECVESRELCAGCVLGLLPVSHPDTPADERTMAERRKVQGGSSGRGQVVRSLSAEDPLWLQREEGRPAGDREASEDGQTEQSRIRDLTLAYLRARARLSAALRGREGWPLRARIPAGHQLVVYTVSIGGEDQPDSASSAAPSQPVHPAQVGRLHLSLPDSPNRIYLDDQPIYPNC